MLPSAGPGFGRWGSDAAAAAAAAPAAGCRGAQQPACRAALPRAPRASLQDFYVACSLGGIVACGATHTAVTPLDVVKCNMQVGRMLGFIMGGRGSTAVGDCTAVHT